MSVLIYCSFKSVNGDLKIVYKCPLFYIVVKSEDDDLKNIFKCPSKFIGIFLVFKTELDYADQFQIPPHKDRTKINCHLAMHLEWKTSPNNKSFSIRKKIIAAFFSNLYFFRWNKNVFLVGWLMTGDEISFRNKDSSSFLMRWRQ